MQPEPMDVVKLKLNDWWSFVKIGLNLHMTTWAFSRYEMKDASLDSWAVNEFDVFFEVTPLFRQRKVCMCWVFGYFLIEDI